MIDRLAQSHPAAVGRWFPLSLPMSDAAVQRFGLSDLVASPEPAGRTHALRVVCDRARRKGGVALPPGQVVTAALLQAVLRYVAARYLEQYPTVLPAGLAAARHASGALPAFTGFFPPAEPAAEKSAAALELILTSLANENPALAEQRPLFDDADLRAAAPVAALLDELEAWFAQSPPVPKLNAPLLDVLRAPMRAHPTSLAAQLAWIRAHWGEILPADLELSLLRAEDVLREELRMRSAGGPGPAEVLSFAEGRTVGLSGVEERERFTPDRDWMPNVVLMAKLVHVWLDQLSKQYRRSITRLDQIPDAELDRLARWGFNGLWLIGLWERSHASKEIKRRMGNPDALASAYSLYDYVIAEGLGGESAYQDLKARAGQRGIRLASDMVPNHVGMDGRWVVDHPDRFLQLRHPPYPGYTFNGPDLCLEPRVGVYLEDGYWSRSDAAVVFKRVDHHTGDVRYIYHGNDGTQMPWNDTAQVDYLNPEAREAVIQTILAVARRFPIIRFDAAMTLAKQHVQRLWFPPPGQGGAVPSRAEHGHLSPEEFDRRMPAEFWREVVDRVQAEVPDTLLLAEAFWLLEGYFVRTLGMHRVYNSAFMNMLKAEDNQKYRQTLKNVLEFSPAVLQRFVNFMSNPDEQTAIEQFGKGDKYIGVAVLMVTLPGLPMFAHGQVEGFTEKYGMEYPRAYREEHADDDLVARHEREVFPLMRRRHLFSGAENFALFDLWTPEGHVDENVFAYANRVGDERAVVLYNNAYGTTRGTLSRSTPINVGRDGETHLVTRSITEALGLRVDDGTYYRFTDQRDGTTWLRHSRALADHGLYAELPGYRYQVLADFREIAADDTWHTLAHELGGRGVHDLDAAYRAVQRRPLVEAARGVLTAEDDAALAGALSHLLDRLGVGRRDVLVADIRDVAERLRAALPPEASPRPHLVAALVHWLGEQVAELPVILTDALVAVGEAPHGAQETYELAVVLAEHGDALRDVAPDALPAAVDELLAEAAVRRYLRVNEHEGVLWFRAERMEALVDALAARDPATEPLAERLRVAAVAAGYQVEKLVDALAEQPVEAPPADTEPMPDARPPADEAGD